MKHIRPTIAVIVFIITLSASGFGQWNKIYTPPTGYSRNQTIFSLNNRIYIVHLDGLVVSTDDGFTWLDRSPTQTDTLGRILETFLDVDFFDDNNGLITTTKHIYRTRDAGFTWVTLYPLNNASYSATFNASPPFG